mmetsp:Transcript_25460/g.79791  ORF Transcript_25460/g.79791 Transcript_25460/m.79791 type:complete len:396 (-) Transcript_25460:372-1559(-)
MRWDSRSWRRTAGWVVAREGAARRARGRGREALATERRGAAGSGEVAGLLLEQQLGRGLGVVKEPVHLLDVLLGDRLAPRGRDEHLCGREQLHGVPQRRAHADLSEEGEGLLLNRQPLDLRPDRQDLDDLLQRVRHRSDDHQPVEQVDRDAVRRHHLRPPDGAHAAVGGEDDDRREGGLERAVEVREALDVEHVHLVDEEDSGDELGDALVNVFVDNLVDLRAELLGDLGLLGLHHLAHQRDEVLPSLRLCVGEVEVVERHVLDHLLLLVHVPLWQRHVLLRLEVKLCGVGVGASDPLDGARVGLDVDDVARRDLLLLDRLVDGRVQLELLGALCRLEAEDQVRHGLAVPAERVLRLLGGELGHLALVHLLRLLDPQADRPPKVLHQHLGLLDLG